MEVVCDLSEDTGPVDGINRGETVGRVDFWVGEESFDEVLRVVSLKADALGAERTWQSSNVPSTARLCTLASMTVVICAS